MEIESTQSANSKPRSWQNADGVLLIEPVLSPSEYSPIFLTYLEPNQVSEYSRLDYGVRIRAA
jgi:hypothetical protein